MVRTVLGQISRLRAELTPPPSDVLSVVPIQSDSCECPCLSRASLVGEGRYLVARYAALTSEPTVLESSPRPVAPSSSAASTVAASSLASSSTRSTQSPTYLVLLKPLILSAPNQSMTLQEVGPPNPQPTEPERVGGSRRLERLIPFPPPPKNDSFPTTDLRSSRGPARLPRFAENAEQRMEGTSSGVGSLGKRARRRTRCRDTRT